MSDVEKIEDRGEAYREITKAIRQDEDAMQRADHIFNEYSGLGSLDDPGQQDEIFEQRSLGTNELETLYEHNSYVRRVIDQIVDESTQRGAEISSSEDLDQQRLKAFRRRVEPTKYIKKANKWGRLYKGALVVMITADSGDTTTDPLDPENTRQLHALRAISKRRISDTGPTITDFTSRYFGEPKWFEVEFEDDVDLRETGGDVDQDVNPIQTVRKTVKIHRSRVVPFRGMHGSDDEEYWGVSKVDLLWNALSNLWQTENSLASHVHTFSKNIFKMSGLRDAIQANGRDAMEEVQNSITAMNLAAATIGAWLIDAEEEDFERQTTNMKGLVDAYDRLVQSFASAADMPVTKLFGTPPAGLSSDDESARRNWDQKVSSNQDEKIRPALRRIWEVGFSASQGPTDGNIPEGFTVDMMPPTEPTEQEKASIAETRSKAFSNLVDRQILTRSEVREFYGDSDKNYLVVVDLEDDAPDVPDEPSGEAEGEESDTPEPDTEEGT